MASKFADAVVVRFGKKPAGGAPAPDDGGAPEQDKDDTGGDDDGAKPGDLGKVAFAAWKKGDPAAFEEAIRRICEDSKY